MCLGFKQDFSQINRNSWVFRYTNVDPLLSPRWRFFCNGSLPRMRRGSITILQKVEDNYGVEEERSCTCQGQNSSSNWRVAHDRLLGFQRYFATQRERHATNSVYYCELLDKAKPAYKRNWGFPIWDVIVLSTWQCQTVVQTIIEQSP